METAFNVLIFLGSVRQPSFTRVLAQQVEKSLRGKGLSVDWVDPRVKPLPIADPDYHRNVAETPSQAVRDLVRQVELADGIILASPLYHGSYSGVLKNAIDCLAYDTFREKPVGLISHGAGAKRCTQSAEHLVPVVRTVYGYALQTQVASSRSDFSLDPKNGEPNLTDEDTIRRCDRLAEEMHDFLNMQKLRRISTQG